MATEVPQILNALKAQLKRQNIRYSELAERLSVSEATMKRYMTGKGLSLVMLERICDAVGIQLSEFIEIFVAEEGRKARELTERQEVFLASSTVSALVFYLLRCGWSSQDVAHELTLEEHELNGILTHLDGIGVILLFPGNKVRLLTARFPTWRLNGPVQRTIRRNFARAFDNLHSEDNSLIEMDTIKVSAAGWSKISQLIEKLSRDIRMVAAMERNDQMRGDWYYVATIGQKVARPDFMENANIKSYQKLTDA